MKYPAFIIGLWLTILPSVCAARTTIIPEIGAPGSMEWTTMSRDEILRRVTGMVRRETVEKYGYDFAEYWKASKGPFSGKFAEAYVSLKFQRFAEQFKLNFEITPTALFDNHSPADLLVRNTSTGRITGYQMKLGNKAAQRALFNPKYKGMKILVPSDELELIKANLRKVMAKAVGRGERLSNQWQEIRSAIRSGRLTDELPKGFKVGPRGKIEQVAEKYTSRIFKNVAGLRRLGTVIATAGKVMERATGPLIVITTAWSGYQDIKLYNSGRIDSSILSMRLGTRVALATTSIYAIYALSGPIGWTVGGITMAGQIAFDYWTQSQADEFKRSLAGLEREDRYNLARAAVLRNWRVRVGN